ncbi:EF-P 5-aminopentanol modification-associated protein YfmF [Tuberibacillus sp. Marseille-P3662]|uniref:EF-P 5-aminopentanol modification-associated protein YfmF n=1 Tax=Tuberibacillus sp. Marseille-P3662 TaxID=1965358 RepID=UPI001592F2F7|nr:pitrilysin family protein [Tuberibacillus sp. Marseille-P3662]
MTLVNENIRELNGINVHVMPTSKFKTNTFVMQFRAPIHRDTVTKKALLSYILKNSSETYPTLQALQTRLDELYGATLGAQLSKKGEEHVLTLALTTSNDAYLQTTSGLLEDAVALISDVILNPRVDNEMFTHDVMTREKRKLKETIASIYDNKMQFAMQRLFDHMCADESFGYHTYGYEEDIDHLSGEAMYQYYQHMLTTDEVDFYAVGDIDQERLYQAVSNHLTFKDRHPEQHCVVTKSEGSPASEAVEYQDVEQAKLTMGYRTHIVMGDALYSASQVFNGLFGGFPNSKLFQNVREKHSLAYTVASRYESYKGLMLVMAGIASEDYQKTVDIIGEQLSAIVNGDFSDDELSQTKALLKSRVLESLDSPFGIVDAVYKFSLSPDNGTLEGWLREIDEVTREDVIEVAKNITLDTVYCLLSKEERSANA